MTGFVFRTNLACPGCHEGEVDQVYVRDVDEGHVVVIDELECAACGWARTTGEPA